MRTTTMNNSARPNPSRVLPAQLPLSRIMGPLLLMLLLSGFSIQAAPTRSQTSPILQYGQPAGGTLAAGEQAEYTFEGHTGDKPVITMNGHGGNMVPYVALYDPQGNLIGEDSHSGPKGNALLKGVVLAADGIYRVTAKNQATSDSGEYSLLISEEAHQFFYDGTPPDIKSPREAYQLSQPWDHTNITFHIANALGQFAPQEVHDVLVQAFQAWSNGSTLTFTEVQGRGDINVEFGQIDGLYNILGETCPPYNPCDSGSVVLDDSEYWALYEPQRYDDISLLGVATHEFGHAIGLLHTNDTNALMYPEYSAYVLQPNEDDIAGLQRLYGARSGPVYNPTPLPGNPTTGQNGQMQVSGQIDDSQYAQFWDFDVVAGDTVTISMSSTAGDLDSFLVLLDGNNNIIAYDDDAAGDKNARLGNLRFPDSGTYTVAATRYAQAQGYTSGTYALGIQYDVGTASSVPTTPPTSNGGSVLGGNGAVRVSSGQSAQLDQLPSLDSVLDSPFANSATPSDQVRSGTVDSGQSYVWQQAWCALDEQMLADNLANLRFTFAVNDQQVDPNLVTRQNVAQGQYQCEVDSLVLSDWQPGSVTLSVTLTLDQAVFDGQTIYPAGDYRFEYDLQAQ